MKSVHPNRLTPRVIAALTVIAIVVICLLLYFVPWTTQVDLVLTSAEVDPEGNVIGTGEIVIKGQIANYLLQHDTFKLTHLELPNRQIGMIYENAYPLSEVYPVPGYYMTNGLVELLDYTTPREYGVLIIFSEDHSLWIIKVTDQIFVGTTSTDADYASIMDIWGNLIDGFQTAN